MYNTLRTKKFAYSFIAVFILTNFLWNIIFRNDQFLLDWGGVTFQIIACLTSVVWLISTFLKHKGAAKSFWLFLGMGILSYLIGTLIWSYNEFILHLSEEENKLPTLFWIVQNGLYFIALLTLMNEIKSSLLTIRFFLDLLIILSAAVTFSWVFLIKPLLYQTEGNIPHFMELLYPILDLGVFIGVISFFIISNSIFSRSTSILLVTGLLIQIIADTIYTYLKVLNIYSVGSVNEPLWILSILLIGLAGIYHVPFSARESKIQANKQTKNLFIKHSTPYLGVLLLTIYMIFLLYEIYPVIVIVLFISLVLVILRQILTLLENEKLVNDLNNLNEYLEVKVKKRTDKLVETLNSMEYLAYHDVVTGLPNRRFMEKRLSQAISDKNIKQSQIAFILLDLDRFKHINDSLGHSFGDLLLKEVGKRLASSLRPNELVCRIGGDEFALLIENTDLQEIEAIAENLLTALRKPYIIKGIELHVTPSIGVSIFPDHGNDLDALLMKADTAMYKVKEKGKNEFKVYNGSMSMEPKMELESSLRKALERDEFILYYQPQISLQTNEMVGLEALLRWERPGYGFVSPAEFIPFAEETGLILPIGEKVLLEACRQSVIWKNKGFRELRIAVNISSLQFQSNNFIEQVSKIIHQTGASPKQIELEITESIAMGPIESNLAKLATLKQMGFQIAMDDFGTGYSSLHYLSQFQIDRLKIDRSFIASLEKGEKDAAIVKLIVMMAKGLDVSVIAEGVEHECQKVFLEKIGCDEYQGYLFSQPLSAEDCEKIMSAQMKEKKSRTSGYEKRKNLE